MEDRNYDQFRFHVLYLSRIIVSGRNFLVAFARSQCSLQCHIFPWVAVLIEFTRSRHFHNINYSCWWYSLYSFCLGFPILDTFNLVPLITCWRCPVDILCVVCASGISDAREWAMEKSDILLACRSIRALKSWRPLDSWQWDALRIDFGWQIIAERIDRLTGNKLWLLCYNRGIAQGERPLL